MSILGELLGIAIEKGAALLDRVGKKLPRPVRVRSWSEQMWDYAHGARVEDWEEHRRRAEDTKP